MSSEGTKVFTQYAVAAGLAMALGPLTALTVASIAEGTAGRVATVEQANPSTDFARVAVSSSPEADGKLLSDVAEGSGSLDFFSNVLTASQVGDMLQGSEQFTVFIPVNAAFSELGGEALSSMMGDPDQLQTLAEAHVVPGRITAPDLMNGKRMTALSGGAINARAGAELRVNGANVIASETAANGIVHFVDRLL